MERFGYVRATSISQAIALLNEPGINSRPLAGGTDLLLLLRTGPPGCDRVVDISQIPDMQRIYQAGERVVIGAGASFSQVMAHPIILRTAPVLAQACRQVGAAQIRNVGTLGGNVANAAACADSLPALVCLDATARLLTPQGEQDCPVSELVRGPNQTIIPTGGLLISLSYVAPLSGSQSVFLKLGRRNAMVISRLTVAALGRLDAQGRIAEARLVPGSTTPHICRFEKVENSLVGQAPSRRLYQAAARLTAQEMTRLAGQRWSSEYKEPVLMAMTARALALVFGAQESA